MILSPKEVAQIDRSVSYVGGSKYTVNDLLETVEFYQSLGESKSLCGHLERYALTEDGGKHIVCLLCEYGEKNPRPRRANASHGNPMVRRLAGLASSKGWARNEGSQIRSSRR